MGLIDYFARKRGYVKPEEMKKRSFSGAQISRLTSSWTTTPKPIDTDIRNGLRILRARSREQSINNDYVRRFLNLTKSNVIGPNGIVLQARSMDEDGTLDTMANNAIEEAWNDWGDFGIPDVTGCMSWLDIQKLFIETIAKDGEVLILIHKNWSQNAYRFALEFVDVECLDIEFNTELKNGNVIRMGVEFNRYRRPVAYHLITTSPTAEHYEHNGKKYQRIPADRVIHRYLPESVWQSRGFPWLASALMRMNMLNAYEEAELVAARVASAKMGFFEQAEGGEYAGEETDTDGNFITDAEPGTFEVLPQGVSFKSWEPNHPTTAFGDFVKVILRGISSGLGVSYFSLANDLEGVNYSSGRLGTLEDREAWKALQNWMITSFCKPIYQQWLDNALLAGAIKVAGKAPSSQKYDKFKRVSWQPRRWAWVDPQKDMNAAKTAIEANIRSTSDVIREQGRDPEEVWQEIAQERKRWKELNIEPAEAGFLMPEENADDAEDKE